MDMKEYYEIVPGTSIGPFKLGMTRDEIEECSTPAKRKHGTGLPFRLMNTGEKKSEQRLPAPGVNIFFDESGRCSRIEALFSYDQSPPVFTLLGHIVNGMTQREAMKIVQAISDDVKPTYAGFYSPSAGLRAVKWEASDDHIMAIQVIPRKR